MRNLDFNSLTLGEISTIEDLSGYGIGALNEEKPQGRFLAALVMIGKRRDGQPAFTFNQAMAVPFNEAQDFLGIEDDVPEPETDTDETPIEPPIEDPADPAQDAEGNGESFGPLVTG